MEETTQAAEAKMEFRAKFNGTCAKCNQPILGWLDNKWYTSEDRIKAHLISWNRAVKGGPKWHTECDALPAPAETGESKIPTESKPAAAAVPTPAAPVPQMPAGDNPMMAIMAQMMAPYLQGLIKANRAELTGEVEAMIQAAVNNASKVIVVENKATGERRNVGRQHNDFPKLLELIAGGENVYMHGAPGSGKSTAAMAAAASLNLRYGYISLSAQTAESRLLGFMNASGEYVETEFFRCYTQGGVFCIDEMDNASANLLTALNSALENGKAAFPHGVFDQHTDFVLVATGNTVGYGANPMFPERRPMDAAFRERFVFLAWEYDESLERDLALAHNDAAGKWIDWVQQARKYAATNYPKLLVTPRASIKGARLLKGKVFKPAEVASMVVFKGFDKDSTARILAANPLPRM